MVFRDSIFGEVKIDDPLAIEIIKNPEFQRLKGVLCQGVPDKYYCFTGFSRYEHSIGVYLILKKLNAEYEEQIAGLLHDISHKAFSHVYDWIIKDYTKGGDEENAQDAAHAGYLESSTITPILLKYGLNPNEIFDLEKYKLLDSEIPDLCADRIEYSIRSLTPEFANILLDNIDVYKNKIVCTNYEIAKEYAYKFLSLQNNEWGSTESAVRYYHFSQILKMAIEHGVLTMTDFDLDDSLLVKKMLDSKLDFLTDKLRVLETKAEIYNYDAANQQVVYKKFRHIDPEILNQDRNELARLSSLDDEFKNALEESRIENNEGTKFSPLW